HSTTSAPPAFSVRIRLAVSVVTCRQAEMRTPSRGFSRSNRSRMAASTGIWRSAHSMRRTPSSASARTVTAGVRPVASRALDMADPSGRLADWFQCTWAIARREQAVLLARKARFERAQTLDVVRIHARRLRGVGGDVVAERDEPERARRAGVALAV